MLQFALLGLGIGGIYAMASQGLILIYRGSGVVNFAQGAVGAVSAFAFFEFHTRHSLPVALSVFLSLVVCALVGAFIHLGIMRPLRRATPLARVIATLGVMSALQGAGQLIYHGEFFVMRSLLPNGRVSLYHGTAIGEDRLIILIIACVFTATLWAIYRFTKFGLATTAVAESEETAQLSGRSPDLIALINWIAGSVLAGIAGLLVAPISGLVFSNLVLIIVPVLAVTVASGFSSFPVTLGISLVIGIIQSEMAKYITTPGWSDSVPFLLVIVILIVRGRSLPLRSHINERLPDIGTGILSPRRYVPALCVMVVVVFLNPNSWTLAVTSALLTATLCVSVVLLTGYAGQLSLAQVAFAGFAGYVATRLAATADVPFLAACVIGVLAAIPVGVIVGAPALRTRGINLAIVTFGLAFAFQSILFQSTKYTGGEAGTIVKPPTILGWPIDIVTHPKRFEAAALVVLVLALVLAGNVRKGRAGRRLIAIRSNERAAVALGIGVPRAKLFAFAVSAGIAGLAGVLIAFEDTFVQYNQFDVFSSVSIVIVSVINGLGYLLGALNAGFGSSDGVSTRIITEFVKSTQVIEWVQVVLAVLLIVTLVLYPDGLMSFIVRRHGERKASSAAGKDIIEAPSSIREPASTDGSSAVPARTERVPEKTLEVRGLAVRFGAVVAVDGISFTVAPGEILGLMGPNGAGKTTVIDAITGFVSCQRGEILLDGTRIDEISATRRARLGLGRSFQSLELFEEISVLENIRVAIESRDKTTYVRDLIRPRTEELPPAGRAAIEMLNLAGDLARRPSELPFGRRRLVAIARTIAAEPSILLLDEPAAGLDENESRELGLLIRRLADDWGIGILLVEHDVPLLMATCSRLIAIDFGKFVAQGTPEEVRSNPDVVSTYLGRDDSDMDEGEQMIAPGTS